MTNPAVALLLLAVLAPVATWCSLRAVETVDLDFLPTHSRRRIQWWQRHCGYAYVASGVLAVLAMAQQIT